jgi:hypothetical protein
MVRDHVGTYLVLAEAIRPLTAARAAEATEREGEAIAHVFWNFFFVNLPHEHVIYARAKELDLFATSSEAADAQFANFVDDANPGGVPLTDANLDTSNYEDGHLFEADRNAVKKVTNEIWTHLSDFDSPGEANNIIEQIEEAIGAPLDTGPVAETLTETCSSNGDAVTVNAQDTPPAPATIILTAPDGTTSTGTAMPNKSGAFSGSWTATAPGRYLVTVDVPATANHSGETGSCTATVVPPTKAVTSLAVTCPATAVAGQPATVSGTADGVPDGATITVSTDAQVDDTYPATVFGGQWSVNFTPANSGTVSVFASYAGDATHLGSQSNDCAISVSLASPTETGSWSLVGSGGTFMWSAQADPAINAILITVPSGIDLTPTSSPSGWMCGNYSTSESSFPNEVLCSGSTALTSLSGTISYSPPASNPGPVTVAGSTNGGMSWGPSDTLTRTQ